MQIGNQAFAYCNGVAEVYYPAANPIDGDMGIFSYDTYEQATLYVVAEAVEKCKTIEPWMYFSNVKAYDPAGIDDAVADRDGACEVYDTAGVRAGSSLNGLAPGLYIVRQGKTVKKVRIK